MIRSEPVWVLLLTLFIWFSKNRVTVVTWLARVPNTKGDDRVQEISGMAVSGRASGVTICVMCKSQRLRIRKEKKETYHVMLKCCQQCRFWSFVPQSWLLSCKYGSDKRSQGAVLQPPHLPQRAARDQAEEHSVHPGQPVHLWLLLSGGCWDCSANCHQGWSGRKKKIPDKNCAQKSLNTTPDCLSEEVMFVIVSACVRVITLCVNVTAWKVWIVCL